MCCVLCVNVVGTFLTGLAGCVVSTVDDVVYTHTPSNTSHSSSTGNTTSDVSNEEIAQSSEDVQLESNIDPNSTSVPTHTPVTSEGEESKSHEGQGYHFLKLDTGMTEVLRPSLYAAKHPLVVVPQLPQTHTDTHTQREHEKYVVVGHCCETGDLLTPGEGSTFLAPRLLARAQIGDLCVIEGCGAYVSSMSSMYIYIYTYDHLPLSSSCSPSSLSLSLCICIAFIISV